MTGRRGRMVPGCSFWQRDPPWSWVCFSRSHTRGVGFVFPDRGAGGFVLVIAGEREVKHAEAGRGDDDDWGQCLAWEWGPFYTDRSVAAQRTSPFAEARIVMTETPRYFRWTASLGMVVLMGWLPPCQGAELEKFTPHHVAKIRAVTSVAISPDGSKIAYVLNVPRKPNVDEDGPAWAELYVVGPDGKSRPYVTGEVNVADPTWTRDGNSILFLAKRGKDEHRSLYKIDADGGEARRVVAFGSDISGFAVKADGKRIAFLATEPDAKPKLDQKKKGFTQILYEEELKPTRLWLATIDDPAQPKLVKLPGSASELRSNPVGEQLALALAPTPSVDDSFTSRKVYVTLAGPAGLVRFNNPGKLGKVAFSPDGKLVAMISVVDKHDPAAGRLVVGSVETGAMKDVLPDYPGHVADIAWSDPDTVAFVGDEGTGTVIGTVDADGSGLSTTPTGDLVVTGFSVAWNGRTAALIGQSPRHPGEVFRAEIGGSPKVTRLTNSNPWLANMEFATQEVVSYKARDGLELQGVLVRPLGVAAGVRVPLVLDVHGGPESHVRNGWVTSYAMPGQVLAAKGIAVFLPNYRGSTGRGVAFSKLSQGDPAGKEFDDLVDAVDHFVNSGWSIGPRWASPAALMAAMRPPGAQPGTPTDSPPG